MAKSSMVLTWAEIEQIRKLAPQAGVNMILYGPPGTGKTKLATTPDSYNVTLTPETPAAELRGHYIPKGNEFVWHDGPGLLAWSQGRPLVVNEIDEGSGDSHVFLGALLDDPEMASITLPTGVTVRPQPGFHVIATTNATDLTTALPERLLNRFPIRINVTEVHPDALRQLADPLANMVKTTMAETPDRQVTLRQAIGMSKLEKMLKGGDASLAARAVFGARGTDIHNSLLLADASATGDGAAKAAKGGRK